jgi:hypothetical protein
MAYVERSALLYHTMKITLTSWLTEKPVAFDNILCGFQQCFQCAENMVKTDLQMMIADMTH